MSDPLDAQTKQVADAYWGTSEPRAAVHDAHGLGEPPRAITIPMQRYLAQAVPSLYPLWLALSILFTLGHVMTIAISGSWTMPPVMPVLLIIVAVISYRSRKAGRAAIERVLIHGALRPAVVTNIRQVQTRREVLTTISYRVDGAARDSFVTSKEQAAAFLQVGLRDEVLWLADAPLVVVPTFLIA